MFNDLCCDLTKVNTTSPINVLYKEFSILLTSAKNIALGELYADNDIDIDSFTSFVWNFRLILFLRPRNNQRVHYFGDFKFFDSHWVTCCCCYNFGSRLSNEGVFSAKPKLLKINKMTIFFCKTHLTLGPDSSQFPGFYVLRPISIEFFAQMD